MPETTGWYNHVVPGQTVSITPVEGENLAGEMAAHTTTKTR